MTITLDLWVIPLLISVTILVWMFRPYHSTTLYDFSVILRLFWTVPLLLVWVIYLGLRVWIGD